MVGAVLQKLIGKIAVGAVNFDSVEPCQKGILRALAIVLDNAGDLSRFECARNLVWYLFPICGEHGPSSRHSRWRDRQYAAGLKGRMRHTTYMPKLQNDLAALGVNLLNHFFPSGNLSSGMNARSSGITLASRGNLSSLRDDQTSA